MWAILAFNLLSSFDGWFSTALNIFGVILISAHIFEYVLYQSRIKNKNDGKFKSIIMTLIFGILYINNSRRK